MFSATASPWSALRRSARAPPRSLDTIAGQHHEIVNEWNFGSDAIVELRVTYDRTDGRQVTIPVVTIFHTDAAGKIDDYRVFFDAAPIYA
ncbi:MAG: hypothetical protein QOC63_4975 [Mycobacterium sp.]|nr:hypothetical protein [Mycobacterium sp.]